MAKDFPNTGNTVWDAYNKKIHAYSEQGFSKSKELFEPYSDDYLVNQGLDPRLAREINNLTKSIPASYAQMSRNSFDEQVLKRADKYQIDVGNYVTGAAGVTASVAVGGLLTGAGVAATIPVVGWIVGGLLLLGAGIVAYNAYQHNKAEDFVSESMGVKFEEDSAEAVGGVIQAQREKGERKVQGYKRKIIQDLKTKDFKVALEKVNTERAVANLRASAKRGTSSYRLGITKAREGLGKAQLNINTTKERLKLAVNKYQNQVDFFNSSHFAMAKKIASERIANDTYLELAANARETAKIQYKQGIEAIGGAASQAGEVSGAIDKSSRIYQEKSNFLNQQAGIFEALSAIEHRKSQAETQYLRSLAEGNLREAGTDYQEARSGIERLFNLRKGKTSYKELSSQLENMIDSNLITVSSLQNRISDFRGFINEISQTLNQRIKLNLESMNLSIERHKTVFMDQFKNTKQLITDQAQDIFFAGQSGLTSVTENALSSVGIHDPGRILDAGVDAGLNIASSAGKKYFGNVVDVNTARAEFDYLSRLDSLGTLTSEQRSYQTMIQQKYGF